WSLTEVTQHMTAFADAATSAALMCAARSLNLELGGLFAVALGKMGGGELNYSSDIDIAVFFDPDKFDGGRWSQADGARRLVQLMTRILSEQTADGYVLRTDLRLRPDPSSTPVAVSTQMAELYYESVGQNWERMVWIKARPFAGDLTTGHGFVCALSPFVWRQHLDYWAINDIHAIKAMINASADRAALEEPNADVKLGPGGIREIEFFAQTQQLIMGGRDPRLRSRETIAALHQLQAAGLVSTTDVEQLSKAYEILRAVEHRVQMRLDEQTHTLPMDEDRRFDVARLCGSHDLSEFDSKVRATRETVHAIYMELFGTESRGMTSAKTGNLLFTGVDPDPGTIKTLDEMGFSDPAAIIEQIGQWHRGHVPATRSPRGRELLTALLPSLLLDMGSTGDADEAFRRFQVFLERLPSGVQTLSMLLAEDHLRKDLVATLALAPRLAMTLGRQPQIIEALLTPDQKSALEIGEDTPFEDAINAARRYVREASFLIGHGLLHGHVAACDAGLAYSRLADRTVSAMATAAEIETVRKFGPRPGDWSIVAFGKLGGEALTAGSDLDLMVVYEADEEDARAPVWFTRFTQRLITALSVETAEGQLYEVDMRLRPSGRSGPVAVRLESFDRYHREDSWTWEHMALTRLRPICDRGGVSDRVSHLVTQLLVDVPRREELTGDILDMRRRLAREKPSAGFWDLKTGEGGLVDLEFIVQRELLMLDAEQAQTPRLADAIGRLRRAGRLSDRDALDLAKCERTLSSLQQIQRLALTGDINPETVSDGLKDRLARAIGAPNFEAVTTELASAKAAVQTIRRDRIGPLENEALIGL
ncbi:MAG: bifunctional [glutamine synthetase] adenylyltransferase/[glutamine synthetase]-adenylyl-L-tyrosine phosphorylase, partial [Pseudomonadota bacterium]